MLPVSLSVLQTQVLILRFQVVEDPEGEPLAATRSAGTTAFEQPLALPTPKSHAKQQALGNPPAFFLAGREGPICCSPDCRDASWPLRTRPPLALDEAAGQERLLWHLGLFHPGPALHSRSTLFCLWRRRASAGGRETGQGSSSGTDCLQALGLWPLAGGLISFSLTPAGLLWVGANKGTGGKPPSLTVKEEEANLPGEKTCFEL